ncbi:sialidase family protein [Brachybacterium saurashtrense]|uniref:exo-alpha-sialidase n=1 Tax=Brachybacterium saurashtrense TaxID=556288 RepID=A0A345YKF7_9MICO|nr:sialidase family protein [Brachybacterium saurashtrense]AXK44409.1 exo-alpha-sialidase [Brachybacterium saurashtrense]RRR23020.1 exo-alpha-sialidase [Brachybacterium saurashtrense]
MIHLGSSPAPVPDAPVPHTVLARAGEGPWPRYRIVGLISLGGGHLLAAFDGRETGQDVPDPTGLVQCRSLDGGRTWGPLETLRDADRKGRQWYCDPSFLHDPAAGRLFVFHTHAKDRGVWDALAGTDDADRDVMGSAVGVSEDGGRSWAFRSVTEVAAPPALLRTAFPTSGSGIVLQRGLYAGRLVQPYCGWFRAEGAAAGGRGPREDEVVRSYVLFSDDHGETWQRGEPVGEDMDETTVVELSDGRVLLNSRDHVRGGHRRIAVSADGGATWEDRGVDPQFVDPGNNAQLAARHPGAPAGDPRARQLLFTNAWDRFARVRGTLSASDDDGATWRELLVFEPGPLDYSAVQGLEDGAIVVLWEVEAREIRVARIAPGTLGDA